MYAVNSLEAIEAIEKDLNEKHIIVLLFVRPNLPGAKDIIKEFSYIHLNAREFCSIYAIGYSNESSCNMNKDWNMTEPVAGVDWYYSDKVFIEFKDKLERRLNWNYCGDIELILLQSNPGAPNILNFENYLAIDVNYGIKNNYIESFPRFMEALVRGSKKEVETIELTQNLQKTRLKIKQVIETSIHECKRIPTPVRRILKDRLFYRPSRSYN